jgi:ribonuclease HII
MYRTRTDAMSRIRILTATLALGLLLLPVTATTAGASAHRPADATADRDDDTERVQEARYQRQTIHLLTSTNAEMQAQALRLVIHYAHVDTLSAQFYRPMTPHLAALARDGDTEALQVMAVSALARVGTPEAMQRLERLTPRLQSERVQRVAERVLTQHRLHEEAAEMERRTRRVVWREW